MKDGIDETLKYTHYLITNYKYRSKIYHQSLNTGTSQILLRDNETHLPVAKPKQMSNARNWNNDWNLNNCQVMYQLMHCIPFLVPHQVNRPQLQKSLNKPVFSFLFLNDTLQFFNTFNCQLSDDNISWSVGYVALASLTPTCTCSVRQIATENNYHIIPQQCNLLWPRDRLMQDKQMWFKYLTSSGFKCKLFKHAVTTFQHPSVLCCCYWATRTASGL